MIAFDSRWSASFCCAVLFLIGGFLLAQESGVKQAKPEAAKAVAAQSVVDQTDDLIKLLREGTPSSIEELKRMEQLVTTLLPKIMAATIAVQVGPSQGSGVIINKEGYVLTAAHVVGEPNKDAVFIMPDGKRYKGKTLGANHDVDAGLMQITDKVDDLPTVEWGDSESLKNGQWVISLGHPGGFQRNRNPVVRLGRVFTSRKTLIATDCTIMPGDSGGPLFDLEGKVIGIHSRIGGPLTANIHVPGQAFRDGWDRMVKGENWGREAAAGPYLGVVGDQTVKDQAKLAQVNPGTPADKAGLKAGDVIQKLNSVEIKSFEQLSELVRKQKVGTTITLQVKRGEETLEKKVRLAARPNG